MRHRVRVRVLTALACVAGVSALSAPAGAGTSGGLHVDPKSPVAKEYALPLASARGAAPESGDSGKLFGSGITTHTATTTVPTTYVSPPASTVTPTPAATALARPKPERKHRRHEPMPAPTVTTATPVISHEKPARKVQAIPAAYTELSPGSGSGVLWMVVVGVLVVVLGGAGGVALSRRR